MRGPVTALPRGPDLHSVALQICSILYITGSHHLTKKPTDIIYIDFAKAFDSISLSKLILKLESYG